MRSSMSREQLERLALVFLLRVLLRVAAQVDALAQVVERGQVLAPVRVERLQHHVRSNWRERSLPTCATFAVVRRFVAPRCDALARCPRRSMSARPSSHCASGSVELAFVAQRASRGRHVPLLLDDSGRHVAAARRRRPRPRACSAIVSETSVALEQLVALLVDHLALVVGDVVVLEQLLADVEVARLDLALRASRSSG